MRAHPDDLHSAIALGREYVGNSRPEDGLPILRELVQRFPDRSAAWDALLAGLDASSLTPDELAASLDRLPLEASSDPRMAPHRGALALKRRDWREAADWYRRAWASDRSDRQNALPALSCPQGRRPDRRADPLDSRFRKLQEARERALTLYEEANSVPTLGTRPHRELCHRLAGLREAMGRPTRRSPGTGSSSSSSRRNRSAGPPWSGSRRWPGTTARDSSAVRNRAGEGPSRVRLEREDEPCERMTGTGRRFRMPSRRGARSHS